MDVIAIQDETYQRYKDLLIRRDQLQKEASSIAIAYRQEFGKELLALFSLRVECIRIKKLLTRCQQIINRGGRLNLIAVEEEIQKEMLLYQKELEQMVEENRRAQKAITSSLADVERAKKLFRKIAMKIHPDIHPEVIGDERISDLWERVRTAYYANNPRELEELEILVNMALEENIFLQVVPDIEDVEERIMRLEREINEILTSEPYTFDDILSDEVKRTAKHDALSREHKEYQEYLEMLQTEYGSMLSNTDHRLLN